MAFIPATNCARVEVIYNYAGETCENTFWVQKSSPYTLAQLQAVRGIVDTWDSTTWKQARAIGATLNRIRTRGWTTDSDPTEDYALPTPRAGTQGGNGLPGNCTFCFKLPTGHAGRSYRGRWYLVGMVTGFLGADPNHMGATAAANILGWLNALQTALTAGGHTQVVVSFQHDHAPSNPAVVYAALPYVYVDLNLDSMRRRLAGRGRP